MHENVICIPTYNSSDNLKSVLEKEYLFLLDSEYDVIVYDSSFDDSVERVVKDFRDKNLSIFYRHVDSKLHSSQKVMHIYEEMENSDYEYIWMIHDHTYFDREGLDCVSDALKKKPDFLFNNIYASENGLIIYDNAESFAVECAGLLSKFGMALLRRDSFLRGIDWNYYKQKYLVPKKMSLSHIGFYLERLSELQNPIIVRVNVQREHFVDIKTFFKTPWNNDAFRIQSECWGENIMDQCHYSNRSQILNSLNKSFLTIDNAITIKENGYYSFRDFIKYKKWLKKIYPERYRWFLGLAILPTQLFNNIYRKSLHKKYCREGYDKLVIYGAGRHAMQCGEMLEKYKIEFDAFVVKSMNNNKSVLLGHPVVEASVFLPEGKSKVIIAVNSNLMQEISQYLEEMSKEDTVIDYIYYS